MTSDYTKDSISDSQNFILQLSEDSITEDIHELVGNNKKKGKDDVIVISDSSCSSSPKHFEKSKWEPISVSRNRNKTVKYKRLYISETSSEDEEEKINLPWRWKVPAVRSDKFLNTKYTNSIQNHKAVCTFDETTVTIATSSSSSNDMGNDRNTKKQTSKFDIKKSCTSTILTPTRQEIKQFNIDTNKEHEIYNVKETIKITTPSNVTCNNSSSVQSRLNQFTVCNTPQQDNAAKVKFTREDAHKIFKNIISTRIVYDSPRKKETNVIIDESTDRDEDIMHPAVSPRYNRGVNRNNSPDVVETSLKDDIIPDSQIDSSKLCNQAHGSGLIDTLKDEDLHRQLSERKKRQITQWLMTNQPDCQSDSSCSNIPASTRNSIESGNSSLERLELNYETPNNRGKIKMHTNEEQTTNTNHRREIQLLPAQQSTLDRFVQRSTNNNSEFCTPDKSTFIPKAHTDTKISSSSAVNKPEDVDMKNCADILDKLYGTSWRNKANVLLPTTEPRKKTTKTIVKAVQTER